MLKPTITQLCTAMHSVHNILWQDSLFSACGLSFYIPTFHMIVVRWPYQFPFWHMLWILSNTHGSRYWYHFFMTYCFKFDFLYIEFLRNIRRLTQRTVFNVDLYVFGKRKTHIWGQTAERAEQTLPGAHNNIPHLRWLLPACSRVRMTSQVLRHHSEIVRLPILAIRDLTST